MLQQRNKDDRHNIAGEREDNGQWLIDYMQVSLYTIHTTAPETHLHTNRSLMCTPTLVVSIVTSKHKQ